MPLSRLPPLLRPGRLTPGWLGQQRAGSAPCARAGLPDWDVQGLEGLDPRGWYLVSPNHQSWVDILVLQRIFHGRIPFLKFFLKQELIWVPVIGLAWWALDFPFMKRGKGSGARGSDLPPRARPARSSSASPPR
jgi:1-acyl-sn-glycerol-3-phosphate acyltransferase